VKLLILKEDYIHIITARIATRKERQEYEENTKSSKPRKNGGDELRAEYKFDYKKARPNRFARRGDKTPLSSP
jgi:hypothetical protein